ncbi:MAG: hypothetical protein JW913_16820 [Chitinispirillaceae bacterium]|nr:hypothetical protein [Chitinispirillaceae bacterium]
MVVKTLTKRFRSYGVFYEQIERLGNIAIYSLKHRENTPVMGYDVVKICWTTLERYNRAPWKNAKAMPGNPDDVVETYPNSSLWGSWAWSFNSYPKAKTWFNQVCQSEAAKVLKSVPIKQKGRERND